LLSESVSVTVLLTVKTGPSVLRLATVTPTGPLTPPMGTTATIWVSLQLMAPAD
jgi:hypothetical protein